MRYAALATDYDGTLARDGAVDEATVDALRRLGASGRRLVVATGRRLPDLQQAFPALHAVADRVVAENGALVFDPVTRTERLLCRPVDAVFVTALRQRGVEPLSVGRAIVATLRPWEAATRGAIRELGLALELSFNKDAVMVLPAGVSKAGGLTVALAELGLRPRDAAGVGDAENDVDFVRLCGLAAAVDNAVPGLKDRVDVVLYGAGGDGVRELVDLLLAGEA